MKKCNLGWLERKLLSIQNQKKRDVASLATMASFLWIGIIVGVIFNSGTGVAAGLLVAFILLSGFSRHYHLSNKNKVKIIA